MIEACGHIRKEIAWKCVCDCGNEVTVSGYYLRSGRTVSCGCKRKEGCPQRSFRYSKLGTTIHRAYTNMKTRCYNPKYYMFNHYGGKGITVCDEWLGDDGFKHFYDWSMLNGYKEGLSIDRIDNNKSYSPDNCRWVDMTAQQNNRTNNRLIAADGEIHTMAEWARINGIHYATIQRRLKCGWNEVDAVTVRTSYASCGSRARAQNNENTC